MGGIGALLLAVAVTLPVRAYASAVPGPIPTAVRQNGLSAEALSHLYDQTRRAVKSEPGLRGSEAAASIPEVGPSSQAPEISDTSYPRPKNVPAKGSLAVPVPGQANISLWDRLTEGLWGGGKAASVEDMEQEIVRIARQRNMNVEIVRQAYREAKRQGVDYRMVLSVIQAESSFDPKAKSPTGARGLMQIMPATGRDLGVRNSKDLYEPAVNIRAGIKYLKQLWDRFSETSFYELASIDPFKRYDVQKAIAAYNAGPGNVEKYGKVPPFRETRAYVKKVLQNYVRYRTAFPVA
ncbi:MAG: lytic transglycosylase domain-containing protein [Elusimicrobiota bacterium]